MFFSTWIDVNGDILTRPIFLINYSFKGGGCYLLLGIVEVDYHFPTITITNG
jgi:DNA polymerase-3 subunit alpha